MSEQSRIVDYRVIGSGAQPVKQESGDRSIMEQVVARWAPLEDEVAPLPWSEVPGEMLRDFLRATIDTVKASYGNDATSKASEVLGASFIRNPKGHVEVLGLISETGASLNLVLEVRDYDGEAVEPMVEFCLAVPEGTTDNGVREALVQIAESAQQEIKPDLVAPIDEASEADLRNVVKQVEVALKETGSDLLESDALLVSASIFLIWSTMETRNAATADFAMSGLTENGDEIAEGKEAVLRATRVPAGAVHDVSEEDDGYALARIRHKLK